MVAEAPTRTAGTSTEESALSRTRRAAGMAARRLRCENRVVSRYGFNLLPSVRYRQDPPVLDAPAAQVVTDLVRDGVTVTDGRGLLGADAPLLDRIEQRVRALQDAHAEEIAERRRALATGESGRWPKPYLVELLGQRPEVDPADPLVAFALHEQVMGIAEEYFRCKVRLHDVNVWQNLATGAPPTKSQRWHRDLLEDADIVKAFLYVDDVPPGAGPLTYVKGTNTPAGRRVKLPETWDGVGFRIADELVEERFGADRTTTAVGRSGDVAWADTLGLHRGGHAQTADRLVVMYTFCSAACCRPRTLVPAPGVRRADLTRVSLRR
ncbi:hypothetical protein GCM10027586_08110 [Kineococcus gypseus]|uniref:hypothetical protein n=1 Tax=Kineococcus gypseus TaxID=1637102 RepID=UPI003D7E46E7